MVNGKVGKFDKTDDEQFVFDKNMIDLKQTSTITIKSEISTIDLTRHNVITAGAMFTKGILGQGMFNSGSDYHCGIALSTSPTGQLRAQGGA